MHYPLDVTGVLGYSKAEVTAGGIDWAEINPKTLESKLVPGLFFAGEILDVDGRIGGFNFQWAWASGYTVAQALIKRSFQMSKKIIKTDKASLPVGPYNQAVSIGNLIYTAGQIPLDKQGNMVARRHQRTDRASHPESHCCFDPWRIISGQGGQSHCFFKRPE